jgi:hypothetical protein
LNAPVGVHNRTVDQMPGRDSSAQRHDDEGGSLPDGGGPADDLPRAQVHEHREIQPALDGRDTGDVADQPCSRPGCAEVALQQIRSGWALAVRAGKRAAPAPGDALDTALTHNASYAFAVDHQALTAQRDRDASGTVGSRGAGVDLDDALGEVIVGGGALAACLLVTSPAEEARAFDAHHLAQPADAGLAALVHEPCPNIDREVDA